MKKTLLILVIGFTINANAQYTDLLDFAGTTNGKKPLGDLIQASDGMLYGVTQQGGANNYGVIFQYNPTTSTYTKKLDFAGVNGAYANGSLMQANDGMLYGMTQYGGTSTTCGANGCGVLFQYNPATSTYTKKIDLAGTNGASPYGSLMQASDGMLYGMTQQGGANNFGVLFQYNPTTNTYTDKIDFAGTTNGRSPYGSLIQASDGMIYGMTYQGGVKDSGVIFQYNPATNAYTDKVDFGGNTKGGFTHGSLMQASDGMLYGMNSFCRVNGGVIFQYNPATSAYTKEFDFAVGSTIINGYYPYGNLMQASDGMLYGMAQYGGAGGNGVLFQYNPASSTYTKMFDFAGTTNGSNPNGSLIQASDGCLYGMASGGGAIGDGVLFKYCAGTTGVTQLKTNDGQINIYPNPATNNLSIQTNEIIKTVKCLNNLGQTVDIKLENNTVNVSALAEGLYFLNITTQDGKTMMKKFIKQ